MTAAERRRPSPADPWPEPGLPCGSLLPPCGRSEWTSPCRRRRSTRATRRTPTYSPEVIVRVVARRRAPHPVSRVLLLLGARAGRHASSRCRPPPPDGPTPGPARSPFSPMTPCGRTPIRRGRRAGSWTTSTAPARRRRAGTPRRSRSDAGGWLAAMARAERVASGRSPGRPAGAFEHQRDPASVALSGVPRATGPRPTPTGRARCPIRRWSRGRSSSTTRSPAVRRAGSSRRSTGDTSRAGADHATDGGRHGRRPA